MNEKTANREPLTRREADTLRYIFRHVKRHKVVPTRSEIAAGIGIQSKQTAAHFVARLAEKGYVETAHRASRQIQILVEPDVVVIDARCGVDENEPLVKGNRIVGELGGCVADAFTARPDLFVVQDNGGQRQLLAVRTDDEVKEGRTVLVRNENRLVTGTCRQIRDGNAKVEMTANEGTGVPEPETAWFDLGKENCPIEGVVVGRLIIEQDRNRG